jgi:HAE1 family hydrophobic/amphiphilic exporter-1
LLFFRQIKLNKSPYTGPFEVENSVTKKVEDAISSLEGVDKVSSVSMENFSLVTLQLKTGTDIGKALQDTQREVNAIQGDFPGSNEQI